MTKQNRTNILLMKRLAFVVVYVLIRPTLFCYQLRRWLLGDEKALASLAETAARHTGILGSYWRVAIYKSLSVVGDDCYIGYQTVVTKHAFSLGDRVYIGRFCSIGAVRIGSDVLIADRVQILSGRHQHGNLRSTDHGVRNHAPTFQSVSIGANTWVGTGAIVMADIGRNCVIAAGAVVTRPVKDNERVAGVPAKPMHDAADRVDSR